MKQRRKLRVLTLAHPAHLPPDVVDGLSEQRLMEVRAALDVSQALSALGHDVRSLGVLDDFAPLQELAAEMRPHIVFNLLEDVQWTAIRDHNIVSMFELLGLKYTGCSPRGMVISRDKALSKKLLAYHHVPVPAFEVYPVGRKVRRPPELEFPLFVKSLTEHSSIGIARASLVSDDAELEERIAFIHEKVGTDAIAEQFIDGRELYVGVVGNSRLQTFPTWELVIDDAAASEPLIATAKVKHDASYQSKRGVRLCEAEDLPKALTARIGWLSKQIYRMLELSGYARIDYRLDARGELYFLDANPNPDICEAEELASAARAAGVEYPELLQRILNLGLRRAS